MITRFDGKTVVVELANPAEHILIIHQRLLSRGLPRSSGCSVSDRVCCWSLSDARLPMIDINASMERARGSQEAGCRSRGVEFAPDSPLEEGVCCELVSEIGGRVPE